MARRWLALIVVLLTTCLPRSAHGQRPADALLGARVRLEMASGQLVTGTVVGVEADSVRLVSHATAPGVTVQRASIVAYEVSAGRERGRGAKRGALIGGVLGLGVLVASLSSDTATVNRQPSRLRRAACPGRCLALSLRF
jgi:hypothetical protein